MGVYKLPQPIEPLFSDHPQDLRESRGSPRHYPEYRPRPAKKEKEPDLLDVATAAFFLDSVMGD
jgi:hypothetical protein